MDEGWVYFCQSLEMDGWLAISGVRRVGKGFVGQEFKRLMEMVKHE